MEMHTQQSGTKIDIQPDIASLPDTHDPRLSVSANLTRFEEHINSGVCRRITLAERHEPRLGPPVSSQVLV